MSYPLIAAAHFKLGNLDKGMEIVMLVDGARPHDNVCT